MKNFLFTIILTPFLASSQTSDDSLIIDGTIYAFPSSVMQFELVKEYDKLIDTTFNVSFTPTKSENLRAIRSGFLEAQLNYALAFDTTNTFDFAPIIIKDSIKYDGLQTSRAPETQDSILSEYVLTLDLQQKIKNDPELTSLNYLLRIGEWTESMFLISKYVRKEKDMSIASRILEQKTIIDNIIVILNEQTDSNLGPIIESFTELQTIYAGIKRKYKYSKPKVDKKNNTTTINSTVIVKKTRKSFIAIEAQLTKLRNTIIN